MHAKDTQRKELAGKTKLTAITMGHGTHRVQAFAMCKHDDNGIAIVPRAVYDCIATQLNATRRGDTVSIG